MICDVLNELKPSKKPYKDLIKFVKDRPGHDEHYAMDTSHIQKKLGWKPTHDLKNGLKKTIYWYLQNKDWY